VCIYFERGLTAAKRSFTLNTVMHAGNPLLGLWTSNPKVTGSTPVGCVSSQIRPKFGQLRTNRDFLLNLGPAFHGPGACTPLSWGDFNKTKNRSDGAENRLFGRRSTAGGFYLLRGFLRAVARKKKKGAEKLGYGRKPHQFLFEAVASLGDAAPQSAAGPCCGHSRSANGRGPIPCNCKTALQSIERDFQRCSGAGLHRPDALYFRAGTSPEKSATIDSKKGHCTGGILQAFRCGIFAKTRHLLSAFFDRCQGWRNCGAKLGRLGQVSKAFGLAFCLTSVSHGPRTNRRGNKNRHVQTPAGSPFFEFSALRLASSVSKNHRLFSRKRNSDLCHISKAPTLAGGFFAQPIQARSKKSGARYQSYTARLQTQFYYSRPCGRCGFSGCSKNNTPQSAGHYRQICTSGLAGALRGSQQDRTKGADFSNLRGQLCN